MRNSITVLVTLSLLVLGYACTTSKSSNLEDPIISHIDSSVKPTADFFLFANGKWFKQHPIPESEQSNGLWQLIQDTINEQVKTICISSAQSNAEKGSNKQKIGDFYFSGMDSLNLNKKKLTDLESEFDLIDNIKTEQDILPVVAHIMSVSTSPMFNFYVGQDDKQSSKNAIFIQQGGLSLPDKRYYTDKDSLSLSIQKKYYYHLYTTFLLMGYRETFARLAAKDVLDIETLLAKASRNREDTRDPLKNYNKTEFKSLVAKHPKLNWTGFFSAVGLTQVDSVIVGQPEFLTALNSAAVAFSDDQWKNYLKYHLLKGLNRYTDDDTYLHFFEFYTTTLRGVKVPKPRWKRVVEQTNNMLGELIGQVYVKEYLPEGTKEKLIEIGNAIKEVYAERIKKLDWMSEVTKEKALKKLSTIIMKMGYPDKWKDMSSVAIDRNSYLKNGIGVNRWSFAFMISRFGKPVDRTEWAMQPQTYNAYYNPSNNEIVIPGCNIIVPGFERKLADDAILYSIIGGSTIGHEITHGFDDQGSQYNEMGNLADWWTPEDKKQFNERTKKIVTQFDEYIAVYDLHINGSLTQGENIADLGGVIMGYEAFKKTAQFKNATQLGGYTPQQRFFLGYAMAWMINERPEATANQVKSNEHSPAKFRVIGPLSNMPEFYEAFGIKQGDAMWRPEEKRVKIW